MTDFVVQDGMPRAIFEAKYSRKTPTGFQTWVERSSEVVAGNCALHPTGAQDLERLTALTRKGVNVWAGRHLQHGDLDQPNKQMEIFTNCSTAMTSFIKFWLLMKGSGVGRAYDSDIARVDWSHMPHACFVLSSSHPDYENWIESAEEAKHKYDDESEQVRWFEVEDSAEGWVKVVEVLETAAFQEKHADKLFIFDFSQVRACGAPIKGQQGRPASGPVPLIKALTRVAQIRDAGMKPWKQAMFIDHYLAECVVLGGVRRSARIATKSWRDRDVIEFIDIKRGGWLYTANNSVTVDEEFWAQAADPRPSHARRVFDAIMSASYFDGTGEPGFLDLSNMHWSNEGVENITADTILSHAMMQNLDIHHRTKDLLESLLVHAKRKKYPFLVNPCVTADTWIETSEGPRQVRDLVGVPFEAIVFGQPYESKGFWSTGKKRVIEVWLEGVTIPLRCTPNHRILTTDSVGVERRWVKAIELSPGVDHVLYVEDAEHDFNKAFLVKRLGLDLPDEEVFDCTVEGIHAYVSNGLYSHNCGEIVLAVWGGYCVIGDICLANADSADEVEEAVRLMARALMRVNLMPALYEAEVKRTNRIGVCLTGVHEWIAKQHGMNVLQMMRREEGLEFMNELKRWSAAVDDECAKYAAELGVTVPHTNVSMKPSGCRPWDALTTTTEGILTLEDLLENHPLDEAWGRLDDVSVVQDEGSKPATKTFYNGEAEVLEIEMSYGLRVQSTYEHPWFVKTRGKEEINAWVPASCIQKGDVLDVKLGTYNKTEDHPLLPVSTQAFKMRADGVEIRQPDRMNPDLGWFFGYLWGDGAQSWNRHRVRFTDENLYNLEKVQRILKEQFGFENTNIIDRTDNSAASLDVGSKHLWMWMLRNGMMKIYEDSLDIIPRVVRMSSKETLIAFIAGLLDADGCVSRHTKNYNKRGITLTTAYPDFANHLQHVLWAVGLGFGCSHNTAGDNFQTRKSMYLMTLSSHACPEAMALLEKHSNKIQNSMDQYPGFICGFEYKSPRSRPKRIGLVRDIREVGKKETYDIEVADNHWYYAGSVKSHNTISKMCATTEGAHAPAYDYYMRWVQYRHDNPELEDLKSRGYPVKDISHAYPETVVVGFPTKMPITDLLGENTVLAGDMSMQDHYDWLSLLETAWLRKGDNTVGRGNNVSYTMKFRPEDVPFEKYRDMVLKNQPHVRTCSVMPQVDMSAYAYQPEERLTKEQYDEAVSTITRMEKEAYDKDALMCEGGACPIEFDIN